MSNDDDDTMDAKAKERHWCKAEKERVRLEAEQKRQEEEWRCEAERAVEAVRVEADCVERQWVVEEIAAEVTRKRARAKSGPMSSVKARLLKTRSTSTDNYVNRQVRQRIVPREPSTIFSVD